MTLELNKLHEILKQFRILYNLSATATLQLYSFRSYSDTKIGCDFENGEVGFSCKFYPQNRWKSQYCSKTANRRVPRPIFLDSARPCASKLLLSKFFKKLLLFLLFLHRYPFFLAQIVCMYGHISSETLFLLTFLMIIIMLIMSMGWISSLMQLLSQRKQKFYSDHDSDVPFRAVVP